MHQLVPVFILDKFDAGEQRGKMIAAAMFVDLSGFSAMSDTLAKHMRHVSDELLASVMHAVFEPLVRSVYAQGGFVVGYAGDAITAIFTDAGESSFVLRCASAAAAIEKQFALHSTQTTPFGEFTISVKIGLSLGEAIWEIYRSEDESEATFSFRGEVMERSAQSEHRAKPGEVWMDLSFYEAIKPHVRGIVADNFFRMTELDILFPEQEIPEALSPSTRHMTAFFSESVVNTTFRGEFRPLVNVFIDLPIDIQEDDRFQGFMRAVFALQKRYGGFFIRPDFGDKGVNLLIFWGAPIAYENDIERAVNFLLELQQVTGIPFTAGVSYRHQYAGFIGSSLREDYTGYGWGISLAARMMKFAAPSEIWVDSEVAQRIEREFQFGEPEERQFKGFAEKQKIYRLLKRKDVADQVFRGTFEGREKELAELDKFIAPMWQGQFAGTLVIKGDAGVGKSRLVFEFMDSEAFTGGRVQQAVCQTDEIVRQSLNPFRYWLRNRFAITPSDSDEENRREFLKQVEQLAEITPDDDLRADLWRTYSFLGALLNLYWEDSLYEQLDAKGRYENTFIALSVLMRCESLQKPLVLVIEDVHWLDEESLAFIPYLVRNLVVDESKHYPIAILATSRVEEERFPSMEGNAMRELILSGLDQKALTRLTRELLGKPASPTLIDFLEKRAEGNPFFVEQVLHYLVEENLLEEKDSVFDLANTNQVDLFSLDVQSVLITRLDRLAQDVKDVVQSASVLGREFEVQLLAKMLDDTSLSSKMDQAESAKIWVPLSEFRYIFRHALMRDAAYSMQLHSRQCQLHELAVASLEEIYIGSLDSHYGELAFHAEKAGLVDKARRYLRLAGDTARDAFENARAENYYTRALNITPERDYEIRYQLLQERSAILATQGKQEACLSDIDQAQLIAEAMGNEIKIGEVSIRRSNYFTNTGDYSQAVSILNNVLQIAERNADDALGLQAILVINQALLRLGKYAEAIEQSERGLILSRRLKQRDSEANLLNTLGMIMVEDKNISASHAYFEQSLSISNEINNSRDIAMALSNLGMVAGQIGNFDAASKYYEQALQLAQKIGHRRGETIVLGNLGWAAGMLGNYAGARTYLERSLQIAREIGNPYSEINALINLSSTTGALGDYDRAISYSNRAVDIARQSNDRNAEAWALTYLGHSLSATGELGLAMPAYQSALEIRRTFAQSALASEPGAGLARVLLLLDKLDSAKEYVEEILDYMEKGGVLDGTDEPVRVYLNCYLVLTGLQDKRARALLNAAYTELKARAANITEAAIRQNFFEQVSYNREVLEAWKNVETDSPT